MKMPSRQQKTLPWETLVSAHLASNEPGRRAYGFEICCAYDTDLGGALILPPLFFNLKAAS